MQAFTEPREIIKLSLKTMEDSRGWKYPISTQTFTDKALADEFAYAMDFYYGGHEMRTVQTADGKIEYKLSSRGYYHYIGS